MKYISILRGINVGGRRKILMADLRALYKDLGFSNVATYIQSGNVVFSTNQKQEGLADKISNQIFERFGFNLPVIIRTNEELEKAIDNNPYLKLENVKIENLCLTFLSDVPQANLLEKLKEISYPPDQFQVIENNIFIYFSGKYSDTKLTNKFFEDKLKISATSRNWKTVNRLLELAKL
ncbi:MAG: DUF1697 domain-containing protein [Bacteroidetes bacterium]|jgi:uncharacterized protein (DUF1697 family)|nr:DUF1697 domain-containing protein [Bacteroidota bacterium]MBT6684968.1 DUF1697 domain-containing protein [Bacteroidota bacterium]MBT7143046.1 DUF1697 domain-containing protein [Bacteroidota bacterium]MBT7491541.1 DUF1697 domain-containing protein [Bacteroidota bacterium]